MHNFNAFSDMVRAGLWPVCWACGPLPGKWGGDTFPDTEWPTRPIPRASAGMLPTVPALAGHTGLRVLGVELAFRQVGEADADGGQGLRVLRLHDVAQEPHPELLGGRGSISRASTAA